MATNRLVQLIELQNTLFAAALVRTKAEPPYYCDAIAPQWTNEEKALYDEISAAVAAEEHMIGEVMDDKVLRKGVPAVVVRSNHKNTKAWVGTEGSVSWVGTTKFGPRVGLLIWNEPETLFFDQSEVEVAL